MITQELKSLYLQELEKLKTEISLYPDEASLWTISADIKNSGGNLCLHLVGNLQAFIGQGLGNSEYERDREFEFAGKDVPREKLYTEIDETMAIIASTLSQLSDAQLGEEFPIRIWADKTSIGFTLSRLYGHLNYHLGQINYHRRLLHK